MDITKEELVELVKTTIDSMKSEPEKTEEEKQEAATEAPAENTCGSDDEDKKEEVENDESVKTEEKPETDREPEEKAEVKSDDVVEAPAEEKEVIKEDVLNSAPVLGTDIASQKNDWGKLKTGKEFLDWYSSNKSKLF